MSMHNPPERPTFNIASHDHDRYPRYRTGVNTAAQRQVVDDR